MVLYLMLSFELFYLIILLFPFAILFYIPFRTIFTFERNLGAWLALSVLTNFWLAESKIVLPLALSSDFIFRNSYSLISGRNVFFVSLNSSSNLDKLIFGFVI